VPLSVIQCLHVARRRRLRAESHRQATRPQTDYRSRSSEVFAAAGRGVPAALTAVRHEAGRLAQLTATLLALLDPELIVFGGGIGQNLGLLEPETRAALKSYTPMTPKFALGELGREAVVLGAIARGTKIAREQVFKERIERV